MNLNTNKDEINNFTKEYIYESKQFINDEDAINYTREHIILKRPNVYICLGVLIARTHRNSYVTDFNVLLKKLKIKPNFKFLYLIQKDQIKQVYNGLGYIPIFLLKSIYKHNKQFLDQKLSKDNYILLQRNNTLSWLDAKHLYDIHSNNQLSHSTIPINSNFNEQEKNFKSKFNALPLCLKLQVQNFWNGSIDISTLSYVMFVLIKFDLSIDYILENLEHKWIKHKTFKTNEIIFDRKRNIQQYYEMIHKQLEMNNNNINFTCQTFRFNSLCPYNEETLDIESLHYYKSYVHSSCQMNFNKRVNTEEKFKENNTKGSFSSPFDYFQKIFDISTHFSSN